MIHYVSGDATYPELQRPDGVKLIVHVCNDVGAWGKELEAVVREVKVLADAKPEIFGQLRVQRINAAKEG